MTALLTFLVLGASCAESRGDRILARDLVDAVPALAAVPGDAALAPAPRPGVERLIRPAEIRSFASRWSVPVEIAEPICVTSRLRTIDASEARTALQAALNGLTGHTGSVDVIALSSRPVPDGELIFPASAWSPEGKDRLRWRGHILSSSGAKYPVWAVIRADTAKIARPVRRMVPRDIKAGDDVRVVASMGATRISIDALAETSGRVGDRITLKNRESGRRFAAIVAAPGQARIGVQ